MFRIIYMDSAALNVHIMTGLCTDELSQKVNDYKIRVGTY